VLTTKMVRRRQAEWRMADEQGLAFLSVMMILLMMTVLGVGALTVTGLENRIAGFASSMEASSAAAESCVAIGVKVIQQTLDSSQGAATIPTALLSNQTPAGPVPQSNVTQLQNEIEGGTTYVPDVPIGPPYPSGVTSAVPNLSLTVGAYTVVGDIDFLYRKRRAGSPGAGSFNYHQAGGTGGGIDLFYRVDCVATNTATGQSSRVAAVYSCLLTDGCQRI
jgi:Tfp pilus assembly protein PilX